MLILIIKIGELADVRTASQVVHRFVVLPGCEGAAPWYSSLRGVVRSLLPRGVRGKRVAARRKLCESPGSADPEARFVFAAGVVERHRRLSEARKRSAAANNIHLVLGDQPVFRWVGCAR